jgi:photosystem II stability/assembly factor-like uncharacterized protein
MVAPAGYEYIKEFHMLTSRDGWAGIQTTKGPEILHTTDGAQTWADVTPPYSQRSQIWDCQFPKANLAWISFYEDGKTRLLLTTNAGESWVPWSPLGSFDNSTHNFFLKTDNCCFFNASNGLVMDMDAGACQATYNFFETHDGGSRWNPAQFSSKPLVDGEPTGTIWGSDCDGSAVGYYPPRTIVMAQGDLGDEKAKGVVRLSLSTDSGKNWRNLGLALPEKYRDRLVQSFAPHFFDATNALMPVCLLKDTTNGFKDGVLVFYFTRDGGNTWFARRGLLDATNNFLDTDCDYVSPRDIYVRGRTVLYATHDGGEHWQLIWQNPIFVYLAQIDFTDAAHGWMILGDERISSLWNCSLCETSNGGKSWTQLPLKISRRSPTALTAR